MTNLKQVVKFRNQVKLSIYLPTIIFDKLKTKIITRIIKIII